MREWSEETTLNRAKAIAHHLHRNLREAYTSEASMEKGKKQQGQQGYGDLMKSMGINV